MNAYMYPNKCNGYEYKAFAVIISDNHWAAHKCPHIWGCKCMYKHFKHTYPHAIRKTTISHGRNIKQSSYLDNMNTISILNTVEPLTLFLSQFLGCPVLFLPLSPSSATINALLFLVRKPPLWTKCIPNTNTYDILVPGFDRRIHHIERTRVLWTFCADPQ